jgi:hypothetical protein
VLEVVPAGCFQGGLERCRPLFVGLGESPHPVGRQVQVAQRYPKGWPAYMASKELPPYFGRESLMRIAPTAHSGGVGLELAALTAAASGGPSGYGAVGCTDTGPSALGIGSVADLLQLLKRPGRPGDQPEREPVLDDRSRHIADGGRLAD